MMKTHIGFKLTCFVVFFYSLTSTAVGQVKVLHPGGTQRSSGCETLSWRTLPEPTVNFWEGHGRIEDTVAVWFQPLAPCSLLAIRFYSYDYEGTFLLNVWDGSRYDGHITTTDSTDSKGWIGDFEGGKWIPGRVMKRSPIGWNKDDSARHYWGLFPFTVTGLHTGQWIEVPTAYGLQGEVDLGNKPFFISITLYQTWGGGLAGENEGTTPYHTFNFFSYTTWGTGPDGEHFGWFIHSTSVWIEAVVKYYEPIPGPYISSSIDYSIDDDEIGESQGNGNGFIEYDEIIELSLSLSNIGNTLASNVTGILKTLNECAAITDSFASFGDIAAGETIKSIDNYVFSVSNLCSPGPPIINFSVEVNQNGREAQHLFFSLDITFIDSFEENGDSNPPSSFRLFQNYPNPFNETTDIRYEIPDMRSPTPTTLTIYNILGQKVKTLVDVSQEAGSYTVTWDGRDESGVEVTSGVYFCTIEAGNFTATKKMLLLK
ncbi:MAG: T9SS type A sorting domain-containing protein [Gemmatimonadota bacterium]|nr:MAG: T9SS type A sorting domain-containing protein [Gemmatimonadota bacterium]